MHIKYRSDQYSSNTKFCVGTSDASSQHCIKFCDNDPILPGH